MLEGSFGLIRQPQPMDEVSFTIEGEMKHHRTDLKHIARRAMIERGLLPDFSAEALAELARIQAAPTNRHSDTRDLRGLLWASIDNDDSRDLDQLTVAEPCPDRSVKILVAIADVDALVTKESPWMGMPNTIRRRSIRPATCSPCCRKNCRLI